MTRDTYRGQHERSLEPVGSPVFLPSDSVASSAYCVRRRMRALIGSDVIPETAITAAMHQLICDTQTFLDGTTLYRSWLDFTHQTAGLNLRPADHR